MGKEQFYHRTFGETSGSDQPFSLDESVDLAGNIRALVQKETKGKVDPVVWLRFKTKNMVKEALGTKAPEEKTKFFIDAFNAYSILLTKSFKAPEFSG